MEPGSGLSVGSRFLRSREVNLPIPSRVNVKSVSSDIKAAASPLIFNILTKNLAQELKRGRLLCLDAFGGVRSKKNDVLPRCISLPFTVVGHDSSGGFLQF